MQNKTYDASTLLNLHIFVGVKSIKKYNNNRATIIHINENILYIELYTAAIGQINN
jgi:hypothetical protein